MLLKNLLFGLAALSLSAPALASPAPMSPNQPSKTSLTKRALEIPVCLTVDLGTIDLTGIVGDVLDTVTDTSLNLLNTLGLGALTSVPVVGPLLNLLLIGVPTATKNLVNAAVNLVARATALLNIPGLGSVDLNDADLGGLCLCLTADALSPDSLLEIRTALTGTDGILGNVADDLLNPILNGLEPVLLGILQNANEQIADECTIPDNASAVVADCARVGDACPTFVCDEGFEECDGLCVADGTCPTTTISRKRSVRERSRFACRQPFTACPVSHFLARESSSSYGGGFECIDTTSNLESCGGCISPFSGNAAGEDCTAIANVDSVSCTAGACVIDSCASGFVPSADGKSCEAASRFSSSRLTVQARRLRK